MTQRRAPHTAPPTVDTGALEVLASRRRYFATVPERDLLAQVLAVAQMYRWRTYHTHTSRHSAAGFPDLTMVRGNRLVFAELKRVGKAATADQRGWLVDLACVPGVEAYVWTAEDLDMAAKVLA